MAMVLRDELNAHLDELLAVGEVRDYCPNGLQVEGREEIRRIVTGVSACRALIERAVSREADALLVHHGIFWGGGDGTRVERSLRGRLAPLLAGGINLFAYHLPLDRHPELGNNAVLARRLGATECEAAFPHSGTTIGVIGSFSEPVGAEAFFGRVARAAGREPLIVPGGPNAIRRFGVVTGRDLRNLEAAARAGLDAYVTGEASEAVVHLAREEGIHFVGAGHHATERFGVQTLGEHLATRFGVEVEFVEIGNPV